MVVLRLIMIHYYGKCSMEIPHSNNMEEGSMKIASSNMEEDSTEIFRSNMVGDNTGTPHTNMEVDTNYHHKKEVIMDIHSMGAGSTTIAVRQRHHRQHSYHMNKLGYMLLTLGASDTASTATRMYG
jgi:hypothetical protein